MTDTKATSPENDDLVLRKKGVLFPCPLCDELVPMQTDKWKSILWNRAGALVEISICSKCYNIIKRDAEREIKNTKLGVAVRIHRGKVKL